MKKNSFWHSFYQTKDTQINLLTHCHIMKNILSVLPFIILMTTPLFAQSSLGKGAIQLIRPSEKRSITENQNYDIELRIPKVKDLKDVTFTHNKRRFKYQFDKRTGQINGSVQLRPGDNVFTLKVKRKTHQFLITYQPNNDNFKPILPRPNLVEKPKSTTLNEFQPEIQTLTISKPYFPIEGKLEGITSRQQILLSHNEKRTNNYTFKNNTIKAKIRLIKGINDITLAIENNEGVDITRWKITYTPEKPNIDQPEETIEINDTKVTNYNEYQLRKKVVNYAQKFKGVRYHYGGESSKGFDCSGFTQYVMRKYDVRLPRLSYEQARKGKKVKQRKAKAGDLVFYKRNGKVSHVSMVLHSSATQLLVIHSVSSSGVIVEDVMKSDYWKPKTLYIRDVISDSF